VRGSFAKGRLKERQTLEGNDRRRLHSRLSVARSSCSPLMQVSAYTGMILTLEIRSPGPLQNNSVTWLLAAEYRLEDDCSVSVTAEGTWRRIEDTSGSPLTLRVCFD